MTTRRTPDRTLVIQIEPGETYQDSLLRRLREYGITQRAICAEMQLDPSQFSRWVARPSEQTGKPVDIGSGTVLQIEAAIETIRLKKRREADADSPKKKK